MMMMMMTATTLMKMRECSCSSANHGLSILLLQIFSSLTLNFISSGENIVSSSCYPVLCCVYHLAGLIKRWYEERYLCQEFYCGECTMKYIKVWPDLQVWPEEYNLVRASTTRVWRCHVCLEHHYGNIIWIRFSTAVKAWSCFWIYSNVGIASTDYENKIRNKNSKENWIPHLSLVHKQSLDENHEHLCTAQCVGIILSSYNNDI